MSQHTSPATEITTPRRALVLFVTLVAFSLLALLAPGVSGKMQGLYYEVDKLNPYLSVLDPALLYLMMPIAVFGSIALVMTPGLMFALALNQARSPGAWLLGGFAISLVLVSTTAALGQHLLGQLDNYDFFISVILLTVLGGILLYFRTASGAQLQWPDLKTDRTGYLLGLIVIPVIFLIVLTPKFFWESFNGDGAHAYESTRLLLHQPFPFWPREAGNVSFFPGMNSVLFTYPASWFIRLFGPYEVSARLPFILYLGLLHAAIVTTGRVSLKQQLGLAGHILISLSIISFGLIMSYSATYDPYCADIALPATQDTLLMICFLCAVLGFLQERPWWMFIFIIFTLLASPGAPLLLGGWLIGVILAYRQRPWRMIRLYLICLIAAFGLMALLPPVLSTLGLPAPGIEHNTGALLSKFDYLIADDFGRLAFLLIPCGIYPMIAILYWRKANEACKALILVTLGVFAMYYLIAFVSLHYFVPVMVLPIVIFWGQAQIHSWRSPGIAIGACFVAAIIAIAIALPSSSAIYTATRDIGESIDVSKLHGYETMESESFRSARLLNSLFHLDSHHEVPDMAYGGAALAFHYYAERAKNRDGRRNYFLQTGTEHPAGTALVAANEASSLYVKDQQLWRKQKALHPAGSQGSAVYAISRDILFGRGKAFKQYRIIYIKPRLNKLRMLLDNKG